MTRFAGIEYLDTKLSVASMMVDREEKVLFSNLQLLCIDSFYDDDEGDSYFERFAMLPNIKVLEITEGREIDINSMVNFGRNNPTLKKAIIIDPDCFYSRFFDSCLGNLPSVTTFELAEETDENFKTLTRREIDDFVKESKQTSTGHEEMTVE